MVGLAAFNVQIPKGIQKLQKVVGDTLADFIQTARILAQYFGNFATFDLSEAKGKLRQLVRIFSCNKVEDFLTGCKVTVRLPLYSRFKSIREIIFVVLIRRQHILKRLSAKIRAIECVVRAAVAGVHNGFAIALALRLAVVVFGIRKLRRATNRVTATVRNNATLITAFPLLHHIFLVHYGLVQVAVTLDDNRSENTPTPLNCRNNGIRILLLNALDDCFRISYLFGSLLAIITRQFNRDIVVSVFFFKLCNQVGSSFLRIEADCSCGRLMNQSTPSGTTESDSKVSIGRNNVEVYPRLKRF
ncbi:hypothetical protein HMPREF9081_1724 [Centipeda periodontii DSM 2778]|uniref:Uncharacterized protein n=1 Tax=Centipeda periodontii DSM 2778 TaxID=888060 RepID=F5RN88_9FIRM|nr:hypothetical protein HMPREF9081_1724 [Centipeda periodontii DSM 2778]EJO22675.1 hypothetical protein HMPREF1148_2016 [Selenomonas sp. FOBRC6]